MKKTLAFKIVLSAAAILVIATILVLYAKQKSNSDASASPSFPAANTVPALPVFDTRWPADDIYFFENQSFLAYALDEDIVVPLFVCSLHTQGKNPIDNYDRFALITDSGIEIPAIFEISARNQPLTAQEKNTNFFARFQLSPTAEEKSTGFLTFTQIKLYSGTASNVVDIGKIQIAFLDSPLPNDIAAFPGFVHATLSYKLGELPFEAFFEGITIPAICEFKFGDFTHPIQKIYRDGEDPKNILKFSLPGLPDDGIIKAVVMKPYYEIKIGDQVITGAFRDYCSYSAPIENIEALRQALLRLLNNPNNDIL